MKADLEAAIRVTLMNLVVALDPNSAFRVSAAGMDDGSGAFAGDAISDGWLGWSCFRSSLPTRITDRGNRPGAIRG
jgi:hypothetical protein